VTRRFFRDDITEIQNLPSFLSGNSGISCVPMAFLEKRENGNQWGFSSQGDIVTEVLHPLGYTMITKGKPIRGRRRIFYGKTHL